MINLQMEIFNQELQNLINKTQLPVGVIRLLLKDILSDINILYNNQLQKQQQNQIIGIFPNKIKQNFKNQEEECIKEDSLKTEQQDKLN